MKFMSQMVLAILAIVGLVAGITYVSQYYARQPNTTPGERIVGPGAGLTFPVKIMVFDPPTLGEFEAHAPGHHDFRFINKNDVPIDLGVMSKSCKCSEIKACVLTEDEAKRYLIDTAYEAGNLIGGAQPAVADFLSHVITGQNASPALQGVKLDWQVLEPQFTPQAARGGTMVPVKPITVPPKGSGFLRFDWDGKKTKEGPDRLKVGLWTQANDGKGAGRDYVELELPLMFVPALRVTPEKYDLTDLSANQEKTAEFYCWSGSRASFTMHARPAQADPCVTASCTPLTSAECASLANSEHTRALAGYRIRVTVRERSPSGQGIDVGPFQRRILLKSDSEDQESYVDVSGTVLGEFTVGSEEDRGKLLLESFPARNGTVKEIVILSRQTGVELKTDGVRIDAPGFADHMKATLKADGPGRWRLTIRVLPNCPPERFVQGSAVVLKIAGTPPRQLRVPLAGRAYQ